MFLQVLSGRKRYHSGIFADFEGGRLRRKGEEIKIHGGGILVIKKNNVSYFLLCSFLFFLSFPPG